MNFLKRKRNKEIHLGVIRCRREGCEQIFRTELEYKAHLKEVYHCPECGWGTADPSGALRALKKCVACAWMKAPWTPLEEQSSLLVKGEN